MLIKNGLTVYRKECKLKNRLKLKFVLDFFFATNSHYKNAIENYDILSRLQIFCSFF